MTIAIDSSYGTQRPYAVSTNDPEAHWGDTVVTQGHADYCAAHGHVTFTATITGKQSERCGRCGELLDTETPAVEPTNAGEDTQRTVLIGISDNMGYSPEQINTHITLATMLESIQEAIETHGEDAKVILDNGQRYGAQFGRIDSYRDQLVSGEGFDCDCGREFETEDDLRNHEC